MNQVEVSAIVGTEQSSGPPLHWRIQLPVAPSGPGRRPGVALGLGLAADGDGFVGFVEVALMPRRGGLTLTGLLGDRMKESARTVNAARYGPPPMFAAERDVYFSVRVPVNLGSDVRGPRTRAVLAVKTRRCRPGGVRAH